MSEEAVTEEPVMLLASKFPFDLIRRITDPYCSVNCTVSSGLAEAPT